MSDPQPAWCRYTAAELQAQYSARQAVPEHPEIFRRWAAQSADCRHRLAGTGRLRAELAYGDHPRERLDLCLPDSPAPAPLHVFFHGGYWQALDRHHFSFVAEALNRGGWAVAVVGYPLCPEVSLERICQSAAAAVAWLRRRAPELGLRAGGMQLAGHSAGGHLVAWLATGGQGGEPMKSVAGIAPVSGVFELEPLVHTAINRPLRLTPAGARELSVLGGPPRGLRLDAFVGGEESDEFQRQTQALVDRWRAADAPAAPHWLAGHNHFTVLDTVYAPEGPMVEAAARLHRG